MKRGFTLIELALVITIVGLIASGVFVGTNLMERARLNSIITDAERYRSAILSFKQKYNYFPGDMPNAQTFWGSMVTPSCAAAITQTSATLQTLTCNGTGNGVIAALNGTPSATEQRESFMMWQHLANAEFITGLYSGFTSSGANAQAISPGVNVPMSKYKDGVGFKLVSWPTTLNLTVDSTRDTPDTGNFPPSGRLGHVFSWSDSASGVTSTGMVAVQDAYDIDLKMDDGLPYSGKVIASETGDASTCIVSSAYNTSVSTAFCSQYRRLFLEE